MTDSRKGSAVDTNDFVRDMLLSANKNSAEDVALNYRIHVVTGDRRGAGTDANVYLVLIDTSGKKSTILRPKTFLSNDHERASTTTIDVGSEIGITPPFQSVEVWRDNFGNLPSLFGRITEHLFGGLNKGGSAAWYLDRIEVEVLVDSDANANNASFVKKNALKVFSTKKKSSLLSVLDPLHSGSRSSSSSSIFEKNDKYTFPVQRWIKADQCYKFEQFDCILPSDDPQLETRKEELQRKKLEYFYIQNIAEGPAQAAVLPSDEKFSDDYFWTFVTDKAALVAKTKLISWTTRKWKSVEELQGVYKKSLGEPESLSRWKDDLWFGHQRIQGTNPLLLKLCKEIPEKLDVTEETVQGILEDNMTLSEALSRNKMFICDLEILDNIKCKEDRILAAPIALFHLKNKQLLPVAIQLYQQKGPLNPVYTPNDLPNTWLVAKMFYNNAEAQHHQGVSHLGLTHLLMEGVCLCTHRNLSPSHPMFKLMAPHFLFLVAINSRGLEKLISPGGWVDCCMTVGVEGIYEVIRRGLNFHHFYRYGNIPAEIESRGVLDPNILPYYPYRDDAVSLFEIIKNYVEKIVHNHYDSLEKLEGDWELNEWRKELSLPKEKGGVGLVGVPGDDTKGFTSIEEVVETIAIIIATCSVGHAAANFQQYTQYAFIPNYAGILLSNPPTEKRDYTNAEIVSLLPDMNVTLETIVITKLLSSRGTKSLGDFEMQYLYHPKDVEAADEFRKELKKLSLAIQIRNMDRQLPFSWLDPEIVPNAISI